MDTLNKQERRKKALCDMMDIAGVDHSNYDNFEALFRSLTYKELVVPLINYRFHEEGRNVSQIMRKYKLTSEFVRYHVRKKSVENLYQTYRRSLE